LKNAISIPQAEFAEKNRRRKIRTSPILLYDLYGYNEAMVAVDILREKGIPGFIIYLTGFRVFLHFKFQAG
jgi:hypothetical protein